MSKLKAFMSLHRIKRDDLISGVNDTAGKNVLYPAKLASHHRGMKLNPSEEEAILQWLKDEKNLAPAKTTIF